MKKKFSIKLFYLLLLCFPFAKVACQSIEDSIMIANSEKWNVKYNQGTFKLSQPGSDQTFTMNLIKLDSGKLKQKKRDSAEIEFSGSDGFDHSKFMTIKKNRVYKLQAGTDENSTEALFAVANKSNQKRQTFLGKVLSKNDEGKNEVLSDTTTIYGTIKRNNAATVWNFTITNLPKNNLPTDNFPFIIPSPPQGFLKSEKDSLFFERASFKADAVLVDAQGGHIGAVKFIKRPFTIWVRKNIDNSLQDAIGVLFGVMIGMREK